MLNLECKEIATRKTIKENQNDQLEHKSNQEKILKY